MCARLERRGGVRNSPSIWLCRATCQTPLLGAGLSQGTVLPTVGKQGPGDIHNRPSVRRRHGRRCARAAPSPRPGTALSRRQTLSRDGLGTGRCGWRAARPRALVLSQRYQDARDFHIWVDGAQVHGARHSKSAASQRREDPLRAVAGEWPRDGS